MRNCAPVEQRDFSGFPSACLVSALALLGVFLLSQPCFAQEPEKEGMGVILSGKATAADVGLPLYPGSKPYKDDSHDSQAAHLGLWGGGSGFNLALMKMQTGDSPDKVAAFYRKALSKYGRVLDCSDRSRPQEGAMNNDSSKTLTCGDDKPEQGGILFKLGTKERLHIVSIEPHGEGSVYTLVALGNWSRDHKNQPASEQ